MKIFLDTSSLFKLYHKETGTGELEELFSTVRITTIFLWEIAKIEFCFYSLEESTNKRYLCIRSTNNLRIVWSRLPEIFLYRNRQYYHWASQASEYKIWYTRFKNFRQHSTFNRNITIATSRWVFYCWQPFEISFCCRGFADRTAQPLTREYDQVAFDTFASYKHQTSTSRKESAYTITDHEVIVRL